MVLLAVADYEAINFQNMIQIIRVQTLRIPQKPLFFIARVTRSYYFLNEYRISRY